MGIQRIKQSIITNLKNIPGWSTDRKIIVFISDDWGDCRIRSQREYENLLSFGLPVDRSAHTRVESMADAKDLERLFDILHSVRDKNDKSAVLSPFTIMANPDFEKIRESDFSEYHYKRFTETLREQPEGDKTIKRWMEGMEEGVFQPELHGREHINVPVWMRKLKSGDKTYRFCFDNRFAHYTEPDMRIPIQASYYYENEEDFIYLNDALDDGIQLFESVFKRSPTVFNPPNAIFSDRYYRTLVSKGVTNIDTPHRRMEPDGKGAMTKQRKKFGEVSNEGLVHFISNCAFEPVKNTSNAVDNAVGQVAAAFKWGKPALINTHRINFVSGRNSNHVDRCLQDFAELLQRIKKNWPDIEFMGAGEFGRFMNSMLKSDQKVITG